ncbi:type II toxin-antitoxin system death-on-curing family toxin [Lacticaseibacillus casei]|uniref:Type II toxin-antitoxin system death-on-curing family toxin n=1 Tax=Lacticaseibacillus huelsenbergensis TaxID=3035291 RepID=A0ABY8DNV8_9LACO|nr:MULTISPECIES: type II toxin-antitoxin system death-on-curing family toxin [Lacticaseibacillus]QVI38071.1 type II toxin-antitoxin system death-on-curing family toxin [Lacticaseibacillus casei]WFB38671.1 type II toxin-antitoxin system death-on-curing family toxin [Lacticaseibacillus huelsenbergensis]WFB43066.1 type II toxin-antitoxin system death-on-curing family toxin [Lacticaseibacillus huelsenbergensis]
MLVSFMSKQSLIDVAQVALNGSTYELKGTEILNVYKDNDNWVFEIKNDKKIIKSFFIVPKSGGGFLDISALERVNSQAESMFREDSLYGIKDRPGLDRIVNSIFNGFGGEEFYPGVLRKATAYWYKLATTQMFYNGNKRTALLAALEMLVSNGYVLNNLSGKELYDITLAIAAKELSKESLWEYVLKNSSLQYFNTRSEALNSDRWVQLNFKVDENADLD